MLGQVITTSRLEFSVPSLHVRIFKIEDKFLICTFIVFFAL